MGQSSTTVQKNEPWDESKPYLLDAMQTGKEMWEADPNQFKITPWDGPNVANMDPTQHAGIQQLNQLTNPMQSRLQNNMQTVHNQQALTAGNHNAGAFDRATQELMYSNVNPTLQKSAQNSAGMYANPWVWDAAQSAGTMGANQTLGTAIRNNMTQGADPRANNVVNQMTGHGYTSGLQDALTENVKQQVMPGVNQTFASSGMGGSSLHQAGLTKAMAAGMAPVQAELLNRSQDRQLAAGQFAQGMHENFMNRQMGAGQAAHGSDVERKRLGLDASSNYTNNALAFDAHRLGAAGMLSDAEQQRLNNLRTGGQMQQDALATNRNLTLQAGAMTPGLVDSVYNPLREQIDQNQVYTDMNKQKLAGDIMYDQQMKSAPMDALNNYMAFLQGNTGQYGTSAATSSQNPGLLGMLGLGMQGVGLAKLLGPGLFASDRRLKEDIRRVGTTDAGLPIYTYRYKGDDPRTYMGVMADEVQQVFPEAVHTRPDGMQMVDYREVA